MNILDESGINSTSRWGDISVFKLISRVVNKERGWSKTLFAMEIKGEGCVLQTSTKEGTRITDSTVFIPYVKIKEVIEDGKVIARNIVGREKL